MIPLFVNTLIHKESSHGRSLVCSASLSLNANPVPHRYPLSGMPHTGGHPSCLIQVTRFSERPCILSPTRSLKASTLLHGLSRRNKNPYSILRQSGLNGSLFFIKVHAMISSLAESFTLIFTLIPFSLCLPRSLLVNHMINSRFLLEAIIAA